MESASISSRHARVAENMEPVTYGEAMKSRLTGRDLPESMVGGQISSDTITADQLKRIMSAENRMIFMREKMNGLADRLFGRRDDLTETRGSIDNDQCVLDRINRALAELEYAGHALETVLDRFDGLA